MNVQNNKRSKANLVRRVDNCQRQEKGVALEAGRVDGMPAVRLNRLQADGISREHGDTRGADTQ